MKMRPEHCSAGIKRPLPQMAYRVDSAEPTPTASSKRGNSTVTVVFAINDTTAFREAISYKLMDLQQAVLKRLSKGWIQAICPKKQANYPYNKGQSAAPPWWPEGVLHREPDHLDKWQRTMLCQHLLTLYASPEQFRGWNPKVDMTDVPTNGEWTKFLIRSEHDLKGLGEPQAKERERPLKLAALYKLLQQREDYLTGVFDGSTTVVYDKDNKIQLQQPSRKRSRRDSVLSDSTELTLSSTSALSQGIKRIKQEHGQSGQSSSSTTSFSSRGTSVGSEESAFEVVVRDQKPAIDHLRSQSALRRPKPSVQRDCRPPTRTPLPKPSSNGQQQEQQQVVPRPVYDFMTTPALSRSEVMPTWHLPFGEVVQYQVPRFQGANVQQGGFHGAFLDQTPFLPTPDWEVDPAQLMLPYIPERHVFEGVGHFEQHPHSLTMGQTYNCHHDWDGWRKDHPLQYPSPPPTTDSPPQILPATVVRGFTGHFSGVGGGAWT